MAIFSTLTSWNARLGSVVLPWSSAKLKQAFLDLYESLEVKLKSNVTDTALRLAWKTHSVQLPAATEDGQTVFAAGLPEGAEVLMVFLPSYGSGTPLVSGTHYTLSGGTLTLIGDVYAAEGERPVILYQTQPVGLPDPEAAAPTGDLMVFVSNAHAAGTPDNRVSLHVAGGEATLRLRKGGQNFTFIGTPA